MNKIQTPFRFIWALWFVLLCAATGSAYGLPSIASAFDAWCAQQPTQATPPQQSRPFLASGSSCALCHTSGSPSLSDLNTLGNAAVSCSGTTCGAAVNPFCVAHAPSNATITAPPAGTTVALNTAVTFTAGNATNPDGFPLAYNWTFTGGLAARTGQSVSVPMTVAGTVTSTLSVRNSDGMLATGTPPTRAVTVTGGGNQAPVATITSPAANVSIAAGGTVTFAGSGTDPDNNTPLTFSWSFPGGSPASSTAQNPGAVRYATAGTFTASLVVRDSLGLASATVTRTITVGAAANQAPVATIVSPATASVSIAQGQKVTFQGSGTDPDNNLPLTYSWSFPGGTPSSSTLQNPGQVTYNTIGTFTATFTVRDSKGLASTPVTRTINVKSPNPVAIITIPAINVSILPGGTVRFQSSASTISPPVTYSWTFQGGTPATSTAQNPGLVTFSTVGAHTVTLVITDSAGRKSASATRVITVAARNQRPGIGQCTGSTSDDGVVVND